MKTAAMPGSPTSPRVSVAICLYNGGRFLAPTLDSLFAQTFPDFEVVLVDDGSTDGSPELARGRSDPRLRILTQPNRGAAAALAEAVAAARGEYVAFLDQDDLWAPDKLASHVAHLDSSPHVELSFSWFGVIDSFGRPLGVHSRRVRGALGFRDLLADFVIGATSNAVARRAAIEQAGGVDPAVPLLYDMDLFLRIALLGDRNVEALPRELMRYRRHQGQMSRETAALEAEWELVFAKMRGLAPAETAAVERRARSNASRYFARLAYENARYGEALVRLSRGFSRSPWDFLTDGRNWTTGGAILSGLALPATLHRRLETWAGLRSP